MSDERMWPPGMDAMARMWTDWARMFWPGTSMPAPASPMEPLREMQSAMLKAWGEWWDRFLRSPEFLDMMKRSMDASVDTRRQANEFFGRVQHEIQAASREDVDQLMRTIRHVERRISDAIERLDARLDEFDDRIDAVEEEPEDEPGEQRQERKRKKKRKAKP